MANTVNHGHRILSENGRLAAQDVKAAILRGEKPNKTAIMMKYGYSLNSAQHHSLMNTKVFKEEMESFAARLAKERDRMLKALESKTIELEDYGTIMSSIDKATKNIQLLTGGDTERVGGAQQVDELRVQINNILIDARNTREPSEGLPTPVEPIPARGEASGGTGDGGAN